MRGRLALAVLGLALWILMIVARLYHTQVERYEHFSQRAQRQQQRIVQRTGLRGRILDARGRLLATSLMVDSAFAVPHQITDPGATARVLTQRVPGLVLSNLERLLKADREFVWVKRLLDPPESDAVREQDLRGIHFLDEPKRYYPLREAAAQALGFVGIDGHGLAGLELFYDRQLGGTKEDILLRDGRRGPFVLRPSAEPRPGQDLRLTLDASIQFFAEQALEDAAKDLGGAAGASVILMRPSDGSILALASYPSFDLNEPAAHPVERQRIRMIRDYFAPGSLFLPVAAAASVEAGLRDPQDFRGFESAADQTSAAALLAGVAQSPAFYEQLRESGFGQLTGIDLPGERAGFFKPASPGDGENAEYPFPQLIVTPVQLATALTQLVNGGHRIQPHLAARSRAAPERLLSPRTVQAMQTFWRREVLRGRGGGAPYNLHRLAGLRGRAVGPLDGPSDATILDTYFGFAPASAPLFAGLVVTVGVRGDTERHGMAAQVFRQIAYNVLRYLRRSAESQDHQHWPDQNRGL